MSQLPDQFLIDIAHRYELTQAQGQTLIAFYKEQLGVSEKAVKSLNIQDGALRERMSEIYKKFNHKTNGVYGIRGKGAYRKLIKLMEDECNEQQSENTINDDDLIQFLREQIREKTKHICNSIKVLSMHKPIELGKIYTGATIIKEIRSSMRRSSINLSDLNEIRLSGISTVEEYSKLIVLGKPGSGKTTLLKYLAMQSIQDECIDWQCLENTYAYERCDEDQCAEKRNLKKFVPFFISIEKLINDSNERDLSNYIISEYSIKSSTLVKVLQRGKALILLDNLEILTTENHNNILTTIQNFIDTYHHCKFVITCRTAAFEFIPKKYFQRFNDVEITDFNDVQINDFVTKWFQSKNDHQNVNFFLRKLNHEENRSIKRLANSPLLLTLLCIVFKSSFDENSIFPDSRSDLYKDSLDVLLRQVSINRDIEQEPLYRRLSHKHKENLLSQLAYFTFNNNQSEFKTKDEGIKSEVINFLRQLPNFNSNDLREININNFFKSIAGQHGLLIEQAKDLYSFSHLTLQEYFVAKHIVDNCDPNSVNSSVLINLISHLTDPNWKEIFLLTVEMLPRADALLKLMKERIDGLLAGDVELQNFLNWVGKKSESLLETTENTANLSAIRACYFDFDIELDFSRQLPMLLDHHFTCRFTCASLLARANQSSVLETFKQVDEISPDLDSSHDINYEMAVTYRAKAINLLFEQPDLDPNLRETLTQLRKKLEELARENISGNELTNWYQRWGDLLRSTIVPYHSLGEEWGSYKFSDYQKDLLKKYYDANVMLANCLKSSCRVDPTLREQINKQFISPTSNPRPHPS